MERKCDIRLGVLFVLLQVLYCGYVELMPCSPGFAADRFLLRVQRAHLQKGTRIGTVVFNDCSGRTLTIFDSADKRFHVASDGTVTLKRGVTLHNGHKMFSVYAWDSTGKRHSALVRVEHPGRASHHHGQQEEDEHMQMESSLAPLILEFPKSSGLRRKKREWVIPPIKILENARGTFPQEVVQIKSSHASECKMQYSISGEGADLPPKALFTINKNTGMLYVSKPLDREVKDKYRLQTRAYSPEDPGIIESPMEVIVEVLDQNDNDPVFTQNPFLGSVPEAAKIGFEFMMVNATDADDPNLDNAEIRYSILSQIPADPKIFDINPITGGIRVNADGLDRETCSEYTLEIQAADLVGAGRRATGKAVITVTDSNDNAPQFVKSSYTVTVPENKVDAVVVKMPETDKDDPNSSAWAAKFKFVSGNDDGAFSITTGPNKQEGIITTVKPLDFETNNKYTLVVAVENEVPFAKPLPTATATVLISASFNPNEETADLYDTYFCVGK